MIELSQKVQLDKESEKQVEQSVSYDTEDDWICITHNTKDITLTVENFRKIVELAEKVLKQIPK